MDIALHRRVARGALFALVLACAWGSFAWAQEQVVPPDASTVERQPVAPDAFFVRTTQLADPLRPLEHLPASSRVRVSAVVATMPDPRETHLGRSFDMVLSATMAAYQAQRFVLDGYAFPWERVDPDADDAKKKDERPRTYRDIPGVLLFRRDAWREAGDVTSPEYAIVFLVGEAPSYGVHLEAFRKAARCAAAYNYARPLVDATRELAAKSADEANSVAVAALQTNTQCHLLMPARTGPAGATKAVGLEVIGPSFSGSMQSLAIAIAQLRAPCWFADVPVRLATPSATVETNRYVDRLLLENPIRNDCNNHPIDAATTKVDYFPVAKSLSMQVDVLLAYLCSVPGRKERRIVVLAEESTFGRGAERVFQQGYRGLCAGSGETPPRVRVYNFPPNIASIRAEHSTLRRAAEPQVPGMPKATGRLLELDMTTSRETLDRPITYEPSLTSRSDELMLYRLFDSLRLRGSTDVVVILATDVRDRLFLLSEVRNALPAALPVMMELDYLAIHPDYRSTSRGAIVVPAGDPIVCLRDMEAGENQDGPILVPCNWQDRKSKFRLFAFATDYAANTFRTIAMMQQHRDRPWKSTFREDASAQLAMTFWATPCLYVATLAGLNELKFPKGADACPRTFVELPRTRSSMVAADARIAARTPTFLGLSLLSVFFLMVAGWVYRRPCDGRVLLSATRYILLDGRWLSEPCHRGRRLVRIHWRAGDKRETRYSAARHVREREKKLLQRQRSACDRLSPDRVRIFMWILFALASVALVLSIWRWAEAGDDHALVHGRDPFVLIALWLLYGCYSTLAFARTKLVDHRIGAYITTFAPPRLRYPPVDKPATWSWVVPMVATGVALGMMFKAMGTPTAVDTTLPSWLALLVLAFGVAFLVNCGRLLRLIGRVTLFVSSAKASIRQREGMKDWPAPQVIHVSPQTPFNLTMLRDRDVHALKHADPVKWGQATCHLVDGPSSHDHYSLAPMAFELWQEQLIAELKAYVVAMRSCAWCAILAPITVFLGMSVYPPIFERAVTTMAALLLIASFSFIVYAVLRLEQDPMLGPMFTRDGDKLTFGGGLRALWPKFVAMGVVLLPLILPSIVRWLHDLIRSVNSFT